MHILAVIQSGCNSACMVRPSRVASSLSASVTSAVKLDKKTIDGIGKRIQDETGQRVELTSEVDPDVLGGIVVRVGNTIMDASVRSRLERLRKRVASAA